MKLFIIIALLSLAACRKAAQEQLWHCVEMRYTHHDIGDQFNCAGRRLDIDSTAENRYQLRIYGTMYIDSTPIRYELHWDKIRNTGTVQHAYTRTLLQFSSSNTEIYYAYSHRNSTVIERWGR